MGTWRDYETKTAVWGWLAIACLFGGVVATYFDPIVSTSLFVGAAVFFKKAMWRDLWKFIRTGHVFRRPKD